MSFMMRPRDSFVLAFTKLRVHRIRLAITLVVMSLLFASLVFISAITAGVIHSFQAFGKEGLGGRYVVSATPVVEQPYANAALNALLQPKQDELVAQKTALAKKYDIPYDAKTDPTLPLTQQQTGPSPSDTQAMANISSPDTMRALAQLNTKLPSSFNDFSALAKKYQASRLYQSTSNYFGMGVNGSKIQVLKDGKEDYAPKQQMTGTPTGIDSINSLGWGQMSDDLLKPFLLDKQTTALGSDGSVPITAPFSAAEQLMGLAKLPATATNQQKLERLEAVRKVAGTTAAICYRNQASQNLLQKAITQVADIAANAKKAGYVMPSVQYNLPTEACGPVTIKKDTRTADEKLADSHQEQLDTIGKSDTEPVQGIFTVRIVGITADVQGVGSSLQASSLVSSIVSSSLGQGWWSPISAFVPGSLATQAQNGRIEDMPVAQQMYYAEFTSLSAAKDFIDQQSCNPNQLNLTGPDSMLKECSRLRHYFTITPFGNNAGAIEDFKHTIWKVARYVLLGVIVIATVVLMGTLGKIIADSRRETAVFRALGARRLHVSQVYIIYTLFVAIMIAALSLVLGIVGALVVSHRLEPGLSVTAVLVYNAKDVHQHFGLFGIDMAYIGIIIAIIAATSLVAASIPLVTNMRRNPIRDMRDE